eukprot:COSAG05_NODE_6403_length_965_cov_1.262125_1_plen_137_part_00
MCCVALLCCALLCALLILGRWGVSATFLREEWARWQAKHPYEDETDADTASEADGEGGGSGGAGGGGMLVSDYAAELKQRTLDHRHQRDGSLASARGAGGGAGAAGGAGTGAGGVPFIHTIAEEKIHRRKVRAPAY